LKKWDQNPIQTLLAKDDGMDQIGDIMTSQIDRIAIRYCRVINPQNLRAGFSKPAAGNVPFLIYPLRIGCSFFNAIEVISSV
jgi:hypothetical protein